jgi:putative ABC transport system permease protein
MVWLEQAVQDLRYALRTLRRNPGFAAAAILTLSLATGATTAIFSVLDAVVLKPLPFPEPDQLVQVYGRTWSQDRGEPDPVNGPLGYGDIDAYRAQATTFQSFAGYSVAVRHLDTGSTPERLNVIVADLEFFKVLQAEPLVGRTFQSSDPSSVAVISARLWNDRFGGSAGVLNQPLRLDDRVYTVIGVMPDRFQFPYRAASLLAAALPESRTDVWIPLDQRRGRVSVVARLKPDVARERGETELRILAARLEQQQQPQGGNPRRRVGVRVEGLGDVVIGPVRRSLWMLFAAVALVLAAACANIANLLLARMSVRAREIVTRAALGAGRARLARQFLMESLCLGLAGAIGGMAIARWGMSLLAKIGYARIPRAHEIGLDWQAFAFLLATGIATAVIFGLAPAFMAARLDGQSIMKGSSGHATMSRRFTSLRDALVIFEVALAFLLASGVSVVIRELVRLRAVDTGMATERVAVLHLTPRATAADYQAIEDRVSQVPGVRAAGLIQMVPLQNWGWEADFEIRGRAPEPGVRRVTELRYVTPGYFRAMGIPIVKGRSFNAGDTATAPRVVIVNETLAKRYFPGEDVVGKELDRGFVVGVAADVRNVRLDRPVIPELYYAVAQNIAMTSDLGMSLVAQSDGDPAAIVPAVRNAVREVRPMLAVFNARTMAQVVDDSLADLNMYRWLIGLFAALALLLAAIGLYGVIAYMTAARTREFAIRLALGSKAASLARLVIGRGMALTALGLAAGGVSTLALSRVFTSLPIGGAPDAPSYLAIAAILLAIALFASAHPALRAAAVDPATALRQE